MFKPKQMTITAFDLKENPERVEREWDEAVEEMDVVQLPYCPVIKDQCVPDCICYIEPKTGCNYTLEKIKESKVLSTLVTFYPAQCVHTAITYQGPD